MKKILLFYIIALCTVLSSCNDDKNDGRNENPGKNENEEMVVTEEQLQGHWSNPAYEGTMYTENFSFQTDSKIVYEGLEDTEDDQYSVIARGTYSIQNNVLTCVYTTVSVYSPDDTFWDFANGKNLTKTYTIESFKDSEMTLTENGKTFKIVKYKDL